MKRALPSLKYAYDFYSLKHAALVTTLCTLFLIVELLFHIPFGILLFIPTFFIPIGFPTQVARGAFETLIGTLLGFLCSALALHFYSSYLLFALIFVIPIFLSSYFLALTRAPLLQIFFILTTAMTLYYSFVSFSSALYLMLWFTINVSISCLLLILLYRTVWPLLFEKIPSTQRSSVLNSFHINLNALIKEQPPEISLFKRTLSHSKTILSLFPNLIQRRQRQKETHFSHFYDHAQKLPVLIETLHSSLEKLKGSPLIETFNPHLKRALQALTKKNIQIPIKSFNELQEFYIEKIKCGYIQTFSLKDSINLIRILHQIEEMILILKEIESPPPVKFEEITHKKKIHFTLPLFKRSAVIALSTLLTVLAVCYLHLPGQYQGIIAALVIIAKPSIDSSFQWAAFRFAGTLFGGILGVIGVMLTALFTYFPFMLILFFSLLLILTYTAFRTSKYYYVFLQATLAYIFITASNPGPEGNIDILFYRLVGVIEGVFISTCIAALFGFESPLKKMKTVLTEHFQLCGEILTCKMTPQLIKKLKGVSQQQNSLLDTLSFTPWKTKKARLTLPMFDQVFAILDEGLYIYSKQNTHIDAIISTRKFNTLDLMTKKIGNLFLSLSTKNVCHHSSFDSFPIDKMDEALHQYILEIREKKLILTLSFTQVTALINHLLFLDDAIQVLKKLKHTLTPLKQ